MPAGDAPASTQRVDHVELHAALGRHTGPGDEAQCTIELLPEGRDLLATSGIDDDVNDVGDPGRQPAIANGILGNEPEQVWLGEKPIECSTNLVAKPRAGMFEALGYEPGMRRDQHFERVNVAGVHRGHGLLEEVIQRIWVTRLVCHHCSLAYSARACLSIGMPGSASFQRAKKAW